MKCLLAISLVLIAFAAACTRIETSNSENSNSAGDQTPTPIPQRLDHTHPMPRTLSGGVMNDIATSLPPAKYPKAAKSVHATGVIKVQVLVDERGNVVATNVDEGHPLLKAAAIQAARKAKFEPKLLSGIPVKVSGYLNYTFPPPTTQH